MIQGVKWSNVVNAPDIKLVSFVYELLGISLYTLFNVENLNNLNEENGLFFKKSKSNLT